MGKCGKVALDIITYFAGLDQPTHPNVISFDVPWHGYRYYMAYTPYPYGNGFEENPCIAASNDLIHWDKPSGLVNPIATSEEIVCDELKDSHLLYREDLDRLEMWYLGRINGTLAEGSPLHCLRKVSTDGLTWSDYEIMYTFSEFNLVSQSVIYDGAYRFWGIRHTKEDTGLYFMRSNDGVHWSALKKCDVPDAALTDMWHGTVIYADKQYHFAWVGNSGKHRDRIYYSNSDDGCCFTIPSVIVVNDAGWDFLYRPCLLKEGSQWYCYYGAIRCDGKWLISMSQGESLECLTGITTADLGVIRQPIEALIASSLKLRMKRYAKDVMKLFTPRLLLCLPLLIVLCFLRLSPLMVWLIAIICGCIGSIVLIEPKRTIRRSIVMGTVNACISVFLFEIYLQILQIIAHLFAI